MTLQQVLQVEQGIERVAARIPDLPVIESLLCRAATILGRDVTASIDRMLRPLDLTDVDFRTLMYLFSRHEGTAHPGDLCSALGQSPANMTRVSDALVERGLITRILSEQDRRRMVMGITEKGEQLVRDCLPKMFGFIDDVFKDFTAAEKARLLSDFKRLLAALDAQCPEGVP